MLKPSRIALAQTKAVIGDVAANVTHHLEFADRAIKEKADAVVFPELSLSGYTLRDLNQEVALDPAKSELLSELRAKSKQITIICGAAEKTSAGAIHNSAFVFEDGALVHAHRKIYPPTYGIFEEQRYFLAGSKALSFESKRLGTIGVLVCEDLWHPSLPYLLTYQGAQCIITIAASPTRLSSKNEDDEDDVPSNYRINKEHHIAYARLFSIYLAFCNRVGVEDGVNFWGGSEIVAPDGSVISRAKFFEEDLIIASLDPALIAKAREYSRHSLDENLLLTREMMDETITKNRT
ncbi:MAG TPA: nitrilase-related carbon-nitrogen hydrolase [Candidatus Kapabacteria bacterium]|nr:nitrilase-related carbon-nitrogen hydrolase [Candidatus Kapabacteria bacterium]HYM34034.1 nitrilase-related carbon-nitrogen hydrolase [Steroidobacteraceae bacterium]